MENRIRESKEMRDEQGRKIYRVQFVGSPFRRKKETGITLQLANGEDKIIYELAAGELGAYQSLGQATGTSLWHLLYLGNKYKANFWERVAGYRIVEPSQAQALFQRLSGQKYLTVEFYEPDGGPETCLNSQ